MQKRKGISLIVLVITIIVMIILAGAIILSLNNAGIIGKANQAVDASNEATIKTLAQLGWAEAYADKARTKEELTDAVEKILQENKVDISDYGILVTEQGVKVVKGWVQDGEIVKRGTQVLNVGADIEYDETVGGTVEVKKDVEWKVLGASESGELLIMSTSDIVSEYRFGYEPTMTDDAVKLQEAQQDWLTIEEQLDGLCESYKYGKDATGSRSITVEDVDRVTGFDKTMFEKGKIYEYGGIVTFSYNGTNQPSYAINKLSGKLVDEHNKGFYYYNGKEFLNADLTKSTTGKITELQNDLYDYFIDDVKTTINKTGDAYTMLFGQYTKENTNYWLVGSKIGLVDNYVRYGTNIVMSGAVYSCPVWASQGRCSSYTSGVRAVVSLAPNVVVE